MNYWIELAKSFFKASRSAKQFDKELQKVNELLKRQTNENVILETEMDVRAKDTKCVSNAVHR